MAEYPKLPNLYLREAAKPHRVRVGEYATEELAALATGVEWRFTEKVDGTNVRIEWDGYRARLEGRTDDAQLPARLVNFLADAFLGERNEARLEQVFRGTPATIYGEGTHPQIHRGGRYGEEVQFTAFDVRIGGYWLRPGDLAEVCADLDLPAVPEVGRGTLEEGVELVRGGLRSAWGDFPAEGIVAFPVVQLLDREKTRIGCKIKAGEIG